MTIHTLTVSESSPYEYLTPCEVTQPPHQKEFPQKDKARSMQSDFHSYKS